jgi:hypothetical protein
VTVELSNLAALAVFGFLLFAGALMLFMVFVQPIWCLVDCAVDRKRSGGAKAVWIIVLVIFYGLASWFYGALAAAGPWLRRLTRLAWLMLALLVVGFVALYSMVPEFRRGIDEEMTRGRALVVQAPAGDAVMVVR